MLNGTHLYLDNGMIVYFAKKNLAKTKHEIAYYHVIHV